MGGGGEKEAVCDITVNERSRNINNDNDRNHTNAAGQSYLLQTTTTQQLMEYENTLVISRVLQPQLD